jgi:hypothetical protein
MAPLNPMMRGQKCQNGALENRPSYPPENCPGISGIIVPYLLKSLSASYRNWCPRFSETRTLARTVDLPLVGPALYRRNVNGPVIGMMARGHVYDDPAWLTPRRRVRAMPPSASSPANSTCSLTEKPF